MSINVKTKIIIAKIKLWAVKRAGSDHNGPISRIRRFFMLKTESAAAWEVNEQLRQELSEAKAQLKERDQKAYESQRELASLQEHILGKVAKALNASTPYPLEQLREKSFWSIWENDTKDGFCLTTGYCMLGGCDTTYVKFTTELAATLYSVVLDELGIKATSKGACSACYAEYLEDCI